MKSVKKIIILLMVFVILVVLIVAFFIFKNKYDNILEKANKIMNVVSNLDIGEYEYSNGVIFKGGTILDTSVYMEAKGKLIKDKYGHIIINLEKSNYYICKTALGKIKISNKCDIKDIEIKTVKNNYQISFDTISEVDGYLISKKDDFKGKFINYTKVKDENLIINTKELDTNYIWFKDKNGNISNVIEFKVECLNVNNEKYEENKLYCPGSIINLYDEKWIVISDKEGYLDLMRFDPLKEKLSHCLLKTSGYCYFNDENDYLEYSWGNSFVNFYLNNTYYANINEEIKNKIIKTEICNEKSNNFGCESEDGCGGYKKEVIDENNWKCNEYVKSNIRILSIDEYLNLIENDNFSNDYNYLMINTSNKSMSSLSALSNGKVFTNESVFEELYVRPVITIKKAS